MSASIAVAIAAATLAGAQAPPGAAAFVVDADSPVASGSEVHVASTSDPVLARASDYVDRFERTFSSVIWREQYVQEQRLTRRFGSSGGRFTSVAARRTVDSEMLLLWLPEDASWIAIRDVVAVDGRERPSTERRLPPALAAGAVSIRHLRQLAQENARFNIGNIVRTFNEPTLALLFLDAQYRGRFAFARSGRDTVKGQAAVTFRFVERRHPTVIQEGNRDVIARGVLWIDETSGEILQTRLELTNDAAHLSGEMTVTYDAHPRFGVRVPVDMRERYTSATGEEVTSVATYSDFRRFETAGRIVPN